jgi:L-fuculose-phosphate aldolase
LIGCFLDEDILRTEIVEVGRLLYERGLVVATDGNISARLAPDRILATPSGFCKGRLAPDQLIVLDLAGERVDPSILRTGEKKAGEKQTVGPPTADLKPTSEIHMHLEAYRQRPDIGAVVHAHPPHVVALSIAGIPLGPCILPEAIVFLGLPPTTPYATPSSPEGAAAIRAAIAGHDALVLARHGSLAVGESPLAAYHNTETLEQLARITFMLRLLGIDSNGSDAVLPPEQIAKLLATRERLGLGRVDDGGEFCGVCGVCGCAGPHPPAPSPKKAGGGGESLRSAGSVEGRDPEFKERVRGIVARVVAEMAID